MLTARVVLWPAQYELPLKMGSRCTPFSVAKPYMLAELIDKGDLGPEVNKARLKLK